MVLYAFAILLNAQVVCGCPVTKHKMALSTFSPAVISDVASTAMAALELVSQHLPEVSISSLFTLMSTLSILHNTLQAISTLEAFISFLCRVWGLSVLVVAPVLAGPDKLSHVVSRRTPTKGRQSS